MIVEHAMYVVLGLLIGVTIMLLFVPPVHNRAVRLTKQRLRDAMPLQMAEISAERDLQRAEFAVSIRRLEVVVDELKTKHVAQLAELGKKTDAINQLKKELGEKRAAILALEGREKELLGRVRSAQEELLDLRSLSLTQLDQVLAERKSQLGSVNTSLADDLASSLV